MGSQRIPRDEQIRLIQKCRNSGMSDSQWCLQHGIRPGTFYNWVSRIKKKGDIHIPPPSGAAEYFPEDKQDIVRINLVRGDGGAITNPEEDTRRIVEPNAYLEYLLEHRPSADMTDEQLEKLTLWNDDVRKTCGNNGRKENLEM